MKKLPIRLKIALLTASLVCAVVVTLGAFTFANFHAEQLEAIDWDLEAAGRRIADLQGASEIIRAADEVVRYEPRASYAIFNAADGSVLGFGGEMPPGLARAALKETGALTVRGEERGWRMMAFRHGQLVIVVALNLDEVREVVRDLTAAYALSLPFVALLCAFGAWWVAGRVLKPVRALTAAAENVQAEKLGDRVPVPPARDEVQRLALVLNSMLSRLEKSFGQARRFAADASHELRTPLTILRGEVERLLHGPGLDAAHEDRLVSIQEEIARLQRTTESLLTLARLDSGDSMMRRETFDLSELVREACEDAELLATSRGVRLEAGVAGGVVLGGDSGHIRRILLNLFDNAVKFNADGGRISCSLSSAWDERGGDKKRVAIFRIGNTGAAIPESLRGRLFERFFRADESRGRDAAAAGGSGLGLSLSREIARAHGGELSLDEAASAGAQGRAWTEFVLTLPM